MNILKGYLSYILAGFAILGGIGGYGLGVLDASAAVSMVWAGLAVFGIRRAITTN